jgi:hypothetical protein
VKKDLVFGQLAPVIALFKEWEKAVTRTTGRAVIQKEITALEAIETKLNGKMPLQYSLSDFHRYICYTWIKNDGAAEQRE